MLWVIYRYLFGCGSSQNRASITYDVIQEQRCKYKYAHRALFGQRDALVIRRRFFCPVFFGERRLDKLAIPFSFFCIRCRSSYHIPSIHADHCLAWTPLQGWRLAAGPAKSPRKAQLRTGFRPNSYR